MRCPKCGQEQTSDELRFCTRCGLAIGDVRELITSESSQTMEKNKPQSGKGVRQGLAIFLFGLILITLLAILRDVLPVPQIFIKIAALIFCVGGAIRMCYPYIFSETSSPKKTADWLENEKPAQSVLEESAKNKALREANLQPAMGFNLHKFETAKLAQPLSVTEYTTKSLEDKLRPRDSAELL